MLASLQLLTLALSVQAAFMQTQMVPSARNVRPAQQIHTFKALVFSKTAGFRHASIPHGIAAIQKLAMENGFEVNATEDAGQFDDANLAQYQVAIFLSTTGDVLNSAQQAAFEKYIQAGGGYVGVHAAADTEYGWGWYGNLVGAYFQSHPNIQSATIVLADRSHPSIKALPERWSRTDEWYNFQINPRGSVHVLATLDERTYSGGGNGYDHPIAWCHEYDGGRAWYTALGHTEASYIEPLFLQHLLGGILFSAGAVAADASATIDANFEKTVLDNHPLDPMSLTVAPDGRVFYGQRAGDLKIYNPADSSIKIAGHLVVTTRHEDGLLGLALDPNFPANSWIYLFYSPAGPVAKQLVSRFIMNGDQLDMGSEKVLLEIPTQREQCCHSAGSLAFGPEGNLFISTGDNTNPFESDGYAPIDERAARSAWDAQKSSSNTHDLRGKVLRITPQESGAYSIPAGNLFPSDGSVGRPEIYVMGCRNPFRISVDRKTGWLYWGDVGPDAQDSSPARGPRGFDEWNQARTAGNYGWPYCIGDNQAYVDYNFATGLSGSAFDCNYPANESPNNTGMRGLPPAKPAWIWYPYAPSAEFPELETGGRTAMAGPTYHYDANLDSKSKLPEYYDNTVFIYEWSRGWLKEVKLDANGNVLKINPFLDSFEFRRPMDMELGPDGALYMLEWGTGFGGGNSDAKLIRIRYKGSLMPPVGVEAKPEVAPEPSFALAQNYPNPFNPTTTIHYELPVLSKVDLSIYNLLGQKVATLVSGRQLAGSYEINWEAAAHPGGVYFYRLETSTGFVQTKKLILLK
ncbi:MAG: ThuA domain-containing protein [bacterium]